MKKIADPALLERVLSGLESKEIGIAAASVELGVSERQVYKLRKARLSGAKPEIRAKKPPSNRTDGGLESRIVELYAGKYRRFSYAHFHERLLGDAGISINFKTLTRILMRHGLISPYAQKKTVKALKKTLLSANEAANHEADEPDLRIDDNIILSTKDIHNRYHHIGSKGWLIQLDARNDFYGGREKWTLHLAIDVASGVFVGAFFDKEETLWGYQNVLHQIIDGYGIPKCILADNRTVFEYISKGSKEEAKNTLTQLEYSCISLGIRLQTTSVATCKAIIERGNGTFGRRLPQELELAGICDMEEANGYLIGFVKGMNSKFARPSLAKNAFRKAPDERTLNNCIGTIARRRFDKACCVKYMGRFYLATANGRIAAFSAKTACLIIKTFDGRLIISVDSVAYDAAAVDDYESSDEKQCNPEGEAFLKDHRIGSLELAKYRESHITRWSFRSFERYVDGEMAKIESKY